MRDYNDYESEVIDEILKYLRDCNIKVRRSDLSRHLQNVFERRLKDNYNSFSFVSNLSFTFDKLIKEGLIENKGIMFWVEKEGVKVASQKYSEYESRLYMEQALEREAKRERDKTEIMKAKYTRYAIIGSIIIIAGVLLGLFPKEWLKHILSIFN